MGYVDDAFANLKSNLEITATESQQAQTRHTNIREYLRKHWDVEDDFLTGSYRRDTKTKKLKDVDIFVVIDDDGPQGAYRDQAPGRVLDALRDLLRAKWPDAYRDGMAIVIPYGPRTRSCRWRSCPRSTAPAAATTSPTPTPATGSPPTPTRIARPAPPRTRSATRSTSPSSRWSRRSTGSSTNRSPRRSCSR